MTQDCASLHAQVGTPQNQITFEILTGTVQIEAIEAQIQHLPSLHEQLKKIALEAWDQITPQEKPKGSYTRYYKDLMKPRLIS